MSERDHLTEARTEALAMRAALREIRGWAEAKCICNPDEADLEIRRIVREALKDDVRVGG